MIADILARAGIPSSKQLADAYRALSAEASWRGAVLRGDMPPPAFWLGAAAFGDPGE